MRWYLGVLIFLRLQVGGESFLTSIDLHVSSFVKYTVLCSVSVDMPFSCGCRHSLRIWNINLLSACVVNVGSWFAFAFSPYMWYLLMTEISFFFF